MFQQKVSYPIRLTVSSSKLETLRLMFIENFRVGISTHALAFQSGQFPRKIVTLLLVLSFPHAIQSVELKATGFEMVKVETSSFGGPCAGYRETLVPHSSLRSPFKQNDKVVEIIATPRNIDGPEVLSSRLPGMNGSLAVGIGGFWVNGIQVRCQHFISHALIFKRMQQFRVGKPFEMLDERCWQRDSQAA